MPNSVVPEEVSAVASQLAERRPNRQSTLVSVMSPRPPNRIARIPFTEATVAR